MPTDKLFTGQRLDRDTGLYYYGARYYDPSLGRFVSPDIKVQNPSNPQTLNRYAYCLNNPLKYIDPSGLDAVVCGGNGEAGTSWAEWWMNELLATGWINPGEDLFFIQDDNGAVGDIKPQLDCLISTLSNKNSDGQYLSDIKMFGFSQGGATLWQFARNLAEGNNMGISNAVISEIKSMVFLERPTGWFADRMSNYDSSADLTGNRDLYHTLENMGISIFEVSVVGSDIHSGAFNDTAMGYSFRWNPRYNIVDDYHSGDPLFRNIEIHGRVVCPYSLTVAFWRIHTDY